MRCEATEDDAEKRVTPGGLCECARVGEQRWNARLPARGMVAVDDEAERIEQEVLYERHTEGELAWPDG